MVKVNTNTSFGYWVDFPIIVRLQSGSSEYVVIASQTATTSWKVSCAVLDDRKLKEMKKLMENRAG